MKLQAIFSAGLIRGVFLVGMGILLSACTTAFQIAPGDEQPSIRSDARVLLMDPDVECSAVRALGPVEQNDVWTAQCRQSVQAAISEFMTTHDVDAIYHDPSELPLEKTRRYRELSALNEVVAWAIYKQHSYPTAVAQTVWTVGDGVQIMRDDYGADYALYIFLRDQFNSAARNISQLAGALLTGVWAPPTQWGFATLVDLDSGDIVRSTWLRREVGDLRNPEFAQYSIDILLENLPIQ